MLLFTSLTSTLEDRIDLLRRLGRTRGIGGLMTVEPILSQESDQVGKARLGDESCTNRIHVHKLTIPPQPLGQRRGLRQEHLLRSWRRSIPYLWR
jgi:hypothetical protein